MRRVIVLTTLTFLACGGDPPPPAHHPEPPRAHHVAGDDAPAPTGPRPTSGSSDGVSCDEARDANSEEVTIGKKGPRDLDVRELAKVLNDGAYLGECDVPSSSKVSVCAAVRGGAALGVTVAMSPSDGEKEKCVAGKIRALAFPSGPRLDVVRTDF